MSEFNTNNEWNLIEQRLLSCVATSEKAMQECIGRGITKSSFSNAQNGRIWVYIQGYRKKHIGHMLTIEVLEEMLSKQAGIDMAVIDTAAYRNILALAENPENVSHLCEKIQDCITGKKFQEIMTSSAKVLERGDIRGAISLAKSSLETADFNPFGDVIVERMELFSSSKTILDAVEARRVDSGRFMGLLCGLPSLDQPLLGFQPGRMVVFCGGPGGYKSTMLFNLAYLFSENGLRVLYINLEMSRIDIEFKILALASRTSSRGLFGGSSNEESFLKVKNKLLDWENMVKIGKNLNIINVSQTRRMRVGELKSHIRTCMNEGKIDIVVLDYIGLLDADVRSKEGRHMDLGDICKSIRGMSQQMMFSLITAAQMKRTALEKLKNVKESEPSGEDVEGSQQIYQDADALLVVQCDKIDPNRLFLHWCKNRQGPLADKAEMFVDGDQCFIGEVVKTKLGDVSIFSNPAYAISIENHKPLANSDASSKTPEPMWSNKPVIQNNTPSPVVTGTPSFAALTGNNDIEMANGLINMNVQK
jgi:replicative DNA helicase